MSILHAKQTGLPADDGNTSHVQPSDWYADHTVTLPTMPGPLVQVKTGTTSTTLPLTPTNGNTLILHGGLNGAGYDFASVTQTGVTWTKITGYSTGSVTGSLFIGLVGSGASTVVSVSTSGVYFTVLEFTGQPWASPSLVNVQRHADWYPHLYLPTSPTSKAVIWVGLNSGGVNTVGYPGEGLPSQSTAIAVGCMMPGGLSAYAMWGSCAVQFYAEIDG